MQLEAEEVAVEGGYRLYPGTLVRVELFRPEVLSDYSIKVVLERERLEIGGVSSVVGLSEIGGKLPNAAEWEEAKEVGFQGDVHEYMLEMLRRRSALRLEFFPQVDTFTKFRAVLGAAEVLGRLPRTVDATKFFICPGGMLAK